MGTRRLHPDLLRPRRLLAAVLAAVLVAILGCAAIVNGAGAAAHASARPIVFGNDYGVWTMRSDGKQLRRLANCAPSWSISANAGRLLMKYHTGDVLLLPLVGDLVRLGDCEDGRATAIMRRYRVVIRGSSPYPWIDPALSPDARRIAGIEAFKVDEISKLRVVVSAANGSGYRRVRPKGLDVPMDNPTSVTWSPLGDELLLVQGHELIAMASDGSNARVVYSDPDHNPDMNNGDHVTLSQPDWSRTGIVFVAYDSKRRNRDGASRLAYVAADGSGFRGLTAWDSLSREPTWSPDGKTIAHLRGAGLYLMNADGKKPRRIPLRPMKGTWCPGRCEQELVPGSLDW